MVNKISFFAGITILLVSLSLKGQTSSLLSQYIQSIAKANGVDAAQIPRVTLQQTKEGYIHYRTPMAESSFETIALFTHTKGHFAAHLTFGCGPACSIVRIRFVKLANGKLIDITEQVLPQEKLNAIEQKAKKLFTKYEHNDNSVAFWIQLPRVGTTISLGIRVEWHSNNKSEFIPLVNMIYSSKKGTFQIKEMMN